MQFPGGRLETVYYRRMMEDERGAVSKRLTAEGSEECAEDAEKS